MESAMRYLLGIEIKLCIKQFYLSFSRWQRAGRAPRGRGRRSSRMSSQVSVFPWTHLQAVTGIRARKQRHLLLSSLQLGFELIQKWVCREIMLIENKLCFFEMRKKKNIERKMMRVESDEYVIGNNGKNFLEMNEN